MDLTILRRWGLGPVEAVTSPEYGTNNEVLVVTAGGRRYVVRAHLNNAAGIIRREHALLRLLDEDPALDLEVPTPLATIDGDTLAGAADGSLVAVYPYLEGVRPVKSLAVLGDVGDALGRLTLALARVPEDAAPVRWLNRPLHAVHPGAGDLVELVNELRRQLPGHGGVEWFAEHWRGSELDIQKLSRNLPQQVIHGDLALSNLLCQHGRISAVLDFEIAGWDLRVNDLVAAIFQICDTASTPEGPAELRALVSSYREQVALTPGELDAMPILARRRALGAVVWRAGRWRRGHATLAEVADRLADGLQIEQHLERFRMP